jgi:hypothetical protein
MNGRTALNSTGRHLRRGQACYAFGHKPLTRIQDIRQQLAVYTADNNRNAAQQNRPCKFTPRLPRSNWWLQIKDGAVKHDTISRRTCRYPCGKTSQRIFPGTPSTDVAESRTLNNASHVSLKLPRGCRSRGGQQNNV